VYTTADADSIAKNKYRYRKGTSTNKQKMVGRVIRKN
jgi:hypothetical protein